MYSPVSSALPVEWSSCARTALGCGSLVPRGDATQNTHLPRGSWGVNPTAWLQSCAVVEKTLVERCAPLVTWAPEEACPSSVSSSLLLGQKCHMGGARCWAVLSDTALAHSVMERQPVLGKCTGAFQKICWYHLPCEICFSFGADSSFHGWLFGLQTSAPLSSRRLGENVHLPEAAAMPARV